MDNRRLILLLIFSFSLVMLWDAWHKYNQPKVAAQIAAVTVSANGSPVPVPSATQTSSTPPVSVPSVSSAPTVAKGEVVHIKTDLYTADVSTQGGDIVGLELNGYKAIEDKHQVFSLFGAKHQYAAQSGLIGESLPNHKTMFSVVDGNRELASDAKTLQLRLEAPVVGGVKVAKVYTFARDSYLINVTYEIENGSRKEIKPHAYYQLQRDTVAPEGESRMVSTFTGPAVYTEQDHYQKINFTDIEKGSAKFNAKADNGWLAMVQHYFVAAWIPQEKFQREYYVRKLEGGATPAVTAGVIVPIPDVAPGAKIEQSVSLYAGPQIQSRLDQLAKPTAEGGVGAENLQKVVDYGWLTIVAEPIFWSLEFIHRIVGNWGWAIVLLTICIKAIFFPLSAASYKSMAKMKTITPRLTALKERYGDDKQKLNQEMMNLYKTEKINPLGGCLPIVVQIPVFIALYWALLGAVEMRDAPWILWIKDLSSQDPYYVLPAIMMITMLIQTKLNPKPPDPIQAKITMFMPFIFGGMFFFFPAGLVLYWVVNNVLSIAQQWQITRMIGRGGKAANDAKA
ncbi:membrane protein insertase YidC [Propionivibrio sp.]|uniref:membrane protein insertase YidC n=1 Tax=Propionivibrio sp. TaxID=2212460 RepID=UPI0025D7B244|nr:membrane protein insertase YidC [Propionivibrio sp.]MBK7354954.1 membrane protein insertase YidC [Propionivibrio sp.]MBK8402321.1 membrane protein insertase YidC [Propionivibrio sp.]MBK8743481.1 membrane protein insertase YidC [Propionivibrio sp.]MBK8892785.1 membrane protein insertase YidC [Propionivibrio sp.]MBL0206561.1 membrane protein insertase YidC [Propionivibrio sp.]